MSSWSPLHCHSHYSLLDGLSKPSQIVDVCSKYGYNACALTDHGSISGSVNFIQACQKKNIKAILGNEMYISGLDATIKEKINGPKESSHLVVLAKNKAGWQQLVKATSRSNDEEIYYYKPRLDLNMLGQYTGDLIGISGHPGSKLADVLFKSRSAYEADEFVPDPVREGILWAEKYQDIFGKGNFFIEIQSIDQDSFPIVKQINSILREVSIKTGIKCVCTADSHYPNREDAIDQRILLCSMLGTTLPKVQEAMKNGDDVGLEAFFRSNNFHIPSPEEIMSLYTSEEIANTLMVAEMCENYDILGRPTIPTFDCPNGMTEDEYLKELCRVGYKKLLAGRIKSEDVQTYVDRINKELEVIQKAGLAGYFLIVQDYVNWGRNKGWLIGPGRGSGAGCLVSYLVGITEVDPIPYGLIFERFYNEGRNTGDHISMPDIDVDFPKFKREELIAYIRERYGHERVAQVATFGRLQGRGALKEVLRIHDVMAAHEINKITKLLPQEAEVIDLLEEMDEDSVIRVALQDSDYSKKLEEYCILNDDGTYSGELAPYFEQAIRLEGTFKTCGKHASAVVITKENANEVCPMIKAKGAGDKIIGMEYTLMEQMGHVKFDILGVAALDKLMAVNDLLRFGEIKDE